MNYEKGVELYQVERKYPGLYDKSFSDNHHRWNTFAATLELESGMAE